VLTLTWRGKWRRQLSTPAGRLPEPSLVLAQTGHQPVRLLGYPKQPISPPKTQNPRPQLFRHWVNSSWPRRFKRVYKSQVALSNV